MLPPPAMTNPNTPIAFVRSAASVKRVMISESATAETTAPPTPCTARAATSMPWLVESPQTTEAAVKSAIPARNIRRCPNRSPRRPPRSRKPPNVSRYAFTTQASEVSVKPRSSRIDGSATFTIVVSRTIIRSPRQRTIRASQRVRVSEMVIRVLSVLQVGRTQTSKLIGRSSVLIAMSFGASSGPTVDGSAGSGRDRRRRCRAEGGRRDPRPARAAAVGRPPNGSARPPARPLPRSSPADRLRRARADATSRSAGVGRTAGRAARCRGRRSAPRSARPRARERSAPTVRALRPRSACTGRTPASRLRRRSG